MRSLSRYLTNFPIAIRLSGAFALILALLGLVIVFAHQQTESIGNASRVLARDSLQSVVLAHTAQGAAQAGAAQLSMLFLQTGRDQRIPLYAQIDKSNAERDAALNQLLALGTNNNSVLQEVKDTRAKFVTVFSRTVDEVELDQESARRMMLAETMPALQNMLAAINKLVILQSKHADQTLLRIQTLQLKSKQSIFVLAFISVLVACASAYFITRSIAVPLGQTARLAADIASGNLDGNVPDQGRDEVGVLITALRDMRSGIREREDKIYELAYKDVLTGLPNRTLFYDRLHQAAKASERTKHPMSVLVLDIDRFKQVNDVLGHPMGDLMLTKVAERLQKVMLRGSDTVARIGGDEFGVLLPAQAGDEGIMVAKRILAALDAPIELEGQLVDVGASIGISSCPEHGMDAADLMSRADIAMYVAKQAGSGYVLFDSKLEKGTEYGLSLLSDLRRAVENNEFILQYQPKMHIDSGVCHSAEVLIRWIHPTKGMVPPDQFIPFAERTGFIKTITRWVLNTACTQAAAWRNDDKPVSINVNVSTRDLTYQDFPGVVAEVLQTTKFPAHSLCLEITESAIMEDPIQALATLTALHKMGVKLSIDDFGTGYSSLAYLKKLPVQELKVDRSFVMNLDSDLGDEMIVKSTVELAHNMGLKVVAEGVENNPILQRLRSLGCDEAQGYFFSKPLPADKFIEWYEAARQTAPIEVA